MSRRRSRSRYLNENLEDLLEMNLFEEDEEEESGESGEDMDDVLAGMDDDDAPAEDSGSSSDVDLGPLEDMSFREVVDAALETAGGSGGGDIDLDSDDEGDEVEEGVDEIHEIDEIDEELEGLSCGPDEMVDEMGEVYEIDEIDEIDEMGEGGMEGIEEKELDEGLFLEIDENMLKREIKNMRRLREGEASDMSSHFGGGSVEREMFIDSDEGDLNVRDGEELYSHLPARKVEAALRNVMRKNRIAEGKNKQYRNALRGMKKQLSEMNLFNAKLLYANKLMQNRDLSIKQQKHIVESLDEAGTLNEAKLLFESLSKSLSRPSKQGGSLNESSNRRVLGSASRSVRSAQSMNEGVALDRWATLAGIKK